jgi:hypothetical protein
VLAPQRVERVSSEYDALVGPECDVGNCGNGLSKFVASELAKAEIGAKLQVVVAPCRIAIGVPLPEFWIYSKLSADPPDEECWWIGIREQSGSRIAQKAQLHGKPDAICITAMSVNCRKVDVAESEQLRELGICARQGEELGPLGCGKDRPAGQVNTS